MQNVLNNRFFEAALQKASRILGKPGRLILLLATMGKKIQESNFSKHDALVAKEKFFTLGRLLQAYARGEYRDIPWKSLLLMAAAVVYFVSPVDLIPDLMPIVGLTDDIAVLVMVYRSISADIDKFLDWEKSRTISVS